MATSPVSSSTVVRVVFFPAAVEAVLNDPRAVAFVSANAEAAREAARDLAPVNTGDTRDSYVASPARPGAGGPTATLGSTSPFWHIVEFGSVNNPAYRVMTRAVERVGLEFKPSRGD